MVEADSHLKLLPPSNLDICKVFLHFNRFAVYWHIIVVLHRYPHYLYLAVIGHGIVGKDIPIMARLAEARRWSKR